MSTPVYVERVVSVGDFYYKIAEVGRRIIGVERLPLGGNEYTPKSHRTFLNGDGIPHELGLSR